MPYQIRAAYQGGQLTHKQRTSPLFSEAPRVGTLILRRGVTLHLSDEQFEMVRHQVERLVAAEAVVVEHVPSTLKPGDAYEVEKVKEELARAAAAAPEATPEEPQPAAVTPVVTETVKVSIVEAVPPQDETKVVGRETPPAPVETKSEPSETKKKGKK